ncbi:MAG: hypothetical protein ABJG88_03930 [Litorimonas sp.]
MQIQDYAALKSSGASVETIYAAITTDAQKLGGGLDDMTQRAVVYHHLYVSSGSNFIFPLIAAHGALWARWYLFLAKHVAVFLAIIDINPRRSFARKMSLYADYVSRFKAINRTVMQETYKVLNIAKLYGAHPVIAADMPKRLCDNLNICHQYAVHGTLMPLEQQRDFYEDFFRWEQNNVVAPAVEEAINAFDWPLMKWFCMRPWVWFSYFRIGRSLVFKNFSDAEERTQKGLSAFDWAKHQGWETIESNLTRNPFFPKHFSFDANSYFKDFKSSDIPPP